MVQRRKPGPRQEEWLAHTCTARGKVQKCGSSPGSACWTSLFPPFPEAQILGWLCLTKRNVLYAIWIWLLDLATINFVTSQLKKKKESFFKNSDSGRAEPEILIGWEAAVSGGKSTKWVVSKHPFRCLLAVTLGNDANAHPKNNLCLLIFYSVPGAMLRDSCVSPIQSSQQPCEWRRYR